MCIAPARKVLGVPWEICDIVWGDTSKHLPYTCASGGSQTTHAMTRASYAVANECKQRLKEIAAKTHGGKPEDYEVANQRVFRKGGGAGMSFAQAAQRAIQLGGIYDGHDVNPDVNKQTKGFGCGTCRTRTGGFGERQVPARRQHVFVRGSFAEVEVDVETGKYYILDFLAYADVGTVLHPAALGGQILGRTTLGHCSRHRPEVGLRSALRRSGGQALLPEQAADDSGCAVDMQWEALDIPDPETPVGARGIGEPPVGGGCAAILNALSDALGDEIFRARR